MNQRLADHIKSLVLGETEMNGPPTVFVSSPMGNRWPEATERHEWIHKMLLVSTVNGLAQRMMGTLIQHDCAHVGIARLEHGLTASIQSSLDCQEGAAVLGALAWHVENHSPEAQEFTSRLLPMYKSAFDLVAACVQPFELADVGIKSWLGTELASICLCPQLLDKLCDFDFWTSNALVDVWKIPEFDANRRLNTMIDKLRTDHSFLESLKIQIREFLEECFGTDKVDWDDRTKRILFISKCEPMLERRFSEAPLGFSVPWGEYLHKRQDSFFEAARYSFSRHGCHCLDEFLTGEPFSLTDPPTSITPVAAVQYRGHQGALELDSLSQLSKRPDELFYVGLYFWDHAEPFEVSENPFRVLHKGHLYVRIRPVMGPLQSTSEPAMWTNYWFKFYTPIEIPNILQELAGMADVTICNMFSDSCDVVLEQVSDVVRLGFASVYLEVNGLNGPSFEKLAQSLPGYGYEIIEVHSNSLKTSFAIIRGSDSGYRIIAPVTKGSWAGISGVMSRMDGNKFVLGDKPTSGPDLCDDLVFLHLSSFGW